MAYRTYTFLLLFVIGFMIGCSDQTTLTKMQDIHNPTYGKWQQQKKPPLHFQLEQTYGNDKDLMFANAYYLDGPVVDQKGNIYVINSDNGAMYSFDPQGNIRWKKGKKGKGPGDFSYPLGLASNGRALYTANVNGSRIDEFDMQGNLTNSTPMENFDLTFTNVLGFLSDTLLVASSNLPGKLGNKIILFNISDDLKKISQFDITPVQNIDLGKGLSFNPSVHVLDSLLTMGSVQKYNVTFYNRHGKKVKTITRNFNKLVRPGFYHSGGSRGIRSFGGLKGPFNLKSGYFIISLNWPTNVKDPDEYAKRSMLEHKSVPGILFKSAIDLYNENGILLYMLDYDGSTPDIGTIAYVDSRGNIYTKTNDPFPQIRKYKVTVGTPVNAGEH